MIAVDGVKDVHVNFETREVTVVVDAAKFRGEALVEALAKAGFEKSTVRTP